MQFKNKQEVFKTGSLKGIVIPDEGIKIKTYYYVRRKINGRILYLSLKNDKTEFTDLSNATPLLEKDAIKHINAYRKQGIKTSLFSSSKTDY